MTWTRPQTFVPGTFLRPCDLCGIRYRSDELRRGDDGFWRCVKTCVEMTQLTRDRISSESNRRREAPPPKWGIPFDRRNSFSSEEAKVFDILATMAVHDPFWPGGIRSGMLPANGMTNNTDRPVPSTVSAGAYSFAGAAEGIRYMYDLITEGQRPAQWITIATAKVRELADWLLQYQTLSGNPDTNLAYGGWDNFALVGGGSSFTALTQGIVGIALLRAYQLLGSFKYLNASRQLVNCVRSFQWASQAALNFTSSDAAGTQRLYVSGHCTQIVQSAGTYYFSSVYSPESLACTEFLYLLKSIDGDATYGGLGVTGAQSFVTTSATTLSSMISDAMAFWRNGIIEFISGTIVAGFSATTPKDNFNAFPSAKVAFSAGTGNWEFANGNASVGTSITTLNWSLGLRSLFAMNGFDTQVSAIWKYLMSGTPNTSFVGPTGSIDIDFPVASTNLSTNPPTPPTGQGNIVDPSWDPKLCLTDFINVRQFVNGAWVAVNNNATGFLNWTTAGLLSPIQSVQDPSSFRKAKEVATTVYFRTPPTFADIQSATSTGGNVLTLVPIIAGFTGLAVQGGTVITLSISTTSVARGAALFRQQPKAFVSVGRPDNTQPGSSPGTLQRQT